MTTPSLPPTKAQLENRIESRRQYHNDYYHQNRDRILARIRHRRTKLTPEQREADSARRLAYYHGAKAKARSMASASFLRRRRVLWAKHGGLIDRCPAGMFPGWIDNRGLSYALYGWREDRPKVWGFSSLCIENQDRNGAPHQAAMLDHWRDLCGGDRELAAACPFLDLHRQKLLRRLTFWPDQPMCSKLLADINSFGQFMGYCES
jgi:hypothetical protein